MQKSGSTNSNGERLEIDLGYLIKRIKQREEEHRRFFEYNNKINSRWNEIADQIFIHDELSKLRSYIHDRLMNQQSQQELDIQLCSRYEQLYECPDPVMLIMKRVTARIIEIAQFGLDSLREPIEYYSLSFARFKTGCLRAANDAISCRPSNMVKIFSRYLQHKINIQAERLREITKCLELSDINSLQDLKEAFYRKLCLKELTNHTKRQTTSKQPIERSDSTSITSIKIIKKEVRAMHSEKQIKIKLIRNEEKQREKVRKLQIKRLKKYVQSLCDVMTINKEQLLEDVFISNKQSESRRIYTELSGRNKHNFGQIEAYLLKKTPNFKEAISSEKSIIEANPIKNLEEELLFEKKVSVEKIKIQSPVKSKLSPTKNQRESNARCSKRESFNTKPRTLYNKQRKTVNHVQEPPVLKEKEVFHSDKQIPSSQFVEINIKNQEPKQRFPEIYARATSVDTVKILKKEAQLRLLKEQKIQKEQQQILRASHESNQTFASKKNFGDNIQVGVNNSNIDKLRGREKIETKIKLELKTMGSNFFEEIGKRISKFCEMKKNLVT